MPTGGLNRRDKGGREKGKARRPGWQSGLLTTNESRQATFFRLFFLRFLG